MANLPKSVRDYFAGQGRIGGKQAAANMTPEAKKARALKAVQARESKKNKKS